MPATIIDLDEILGDPKRVRLAGKVYTLPADVPVELFLQVNKLSQQEDRAESEIVEQMYEDLLGLFRVHQPTLKALPISLGQLLVAFSTIYGKEEEPAKPTRPPGATRSRGVPRSNRRTPKSGSSTS